MTSKTIGILADDLTGANDTGVQFSRLGGAVLVLVSLERLPARLELRWDVLVLNTGSRNLAPREARARVAAAMDYLKRQSIPLVYKKIDSTLRGNLVPELEELFARGARQAFLAPAFPINGRTVEGGVLKVGGAAVHETEMGRDELSPVRSGDIRSLLEPAFRGAVGTIGLERLAQGAPALAPLLAAMEREGRWVIVCDARVQGDLAVLAEALRPALPGPVLVGSAGLARELAACLSLRSRARPRWRASAPGPVLVAAGSRSGVTAEQVRRLSEAYRTAEAVIAPEWVDGHWDEARAEVLGGRVDSALDAAHAVAGEPDVLLITLGAGEEGLAPERFRTRSTRLNRVMGCAIARRLERRALAGVVLTGGDVAAAAMEALGAEGIELDEEVLPGIPLGRLAGGSRAGLPLVTKAGGFGGPEALTVAVRDLLGGSDARGEPRAET